MLPVLNRSAALGLLSSMENPEQEQRGYKRQGLLSDLFPITQIRPVKDLNIGFYLSSVTRLPALGLCYRSSGRQAKDVALDYTTDKRAFVDTRSFCQVFVNLGEDRHDITALPQKLPKDFLYSPASLSAGEVETVIYSRILIFLTRILHHTVFCLPIAVSKLW